MESSVALRTLQKGLPAGATDPTPVLLTSTDGQILDKVALPVFAAEVGKAAGVAQVAPGIPSDDGTTCVTPVFVDFQKRDEP